MFWVAIRINTDPTKYDRGCVFQCNGFPRICPGADPNTPAAQECFYMCADAAASDGSELTDAASGYTVRGEVPVAPLADGDLSDGTYTVRQDAAP